MHSLDCRSTANLLQQRLTPQHMHCHHPPCFHAKLKPCLERALSTKILGYCGNAHNTKSLSGVLVYRQVCACRGAGATAFWVKAINQWLRNSMFAVSSKPLREVAVVTSPLRWEATFKQLEVYRYCDEPGSEI